jgi:hypothetical protein
MRLLWLALGLTLASSALPQAIDCTPAYTAEIAARSDGIGIYWEIDGYPARCQISGGVPTWYLGVPTVGTTIDASSGQPIVTVIWMPLGTPLPLAPSNVNVE